MDVKSINTIKINNYSKRLRQLNKKLSQCVSECNDLFNDNEFFEIWKNINNLSNTEAQAQIKLLKKKMKQHSDSAEKIDYKTSQNDINIINEMMDFLYKLKN